MNQQIAALDRTLRLMRDEFGFEISDLDLFEALKSVRVALVADERNIQSHPAQSAFVTAAILMARSGHQVYVRAPNIDLKGPQPPLGPGRLIDELQRVGECLLPGGGLKILSPGDPVDIAISLGDTGGLPNASRNISINAEAWMAELTSSEKAEAWKAGVWPFGALAAAGLAANEAFKLAVRSLLHRALDSENTAARFADSVDCRFELAPSDTPFCRDLGRLDMVSGGAITNSALFCLARIPGATARCRVIEPDYAEVTNLNRYMLLKTSDLGSEKASQLAAQFRESGSGILITPIVRRYDEGSVLEIGPLSPTVVVGVDHIPTRWVVQGDKPQQLVVGATTHWSAMASNHSGYGGCARCLHHQDDPGNDIIPTHACVSFWSGLLSATYVALLMVGRANDHRTQQVFLTPFRPESKYTAPVPQRLDCPVCAAGELRAADGRASKKIAV